MRTTEYWYLQWWSTIEQKYRYPYRETNRHTYILAKTSAGWRVELMQNWTLLAAEGKFNRIAPLV